MAGESPDRSKQRESSEEATPGSASPVPESRDPRLAVARGGVDTATRVFSTRDAAQARKPAEPADGDESAEGAAAEGAAPQGDTRLRAAAAAWVRPGDGSSTDAADGESAESPETAADGPSGGSGAGRGAEPAETPEEAVTDPSNTDATDGPGDDSDASDDAAEDAGTATDGEAAGSDEEPGDGDDDRTPAAGTPVDVPGDAGEATGARSAASGDTEATDERRDTPAEADAEADDSGDDADGTATDDQAATAATTAGDGSGTKLATATAAAAAEDDEPADGASAPDESSAGTPGTGDSPAGKASAADDEPADGASADDASSAGTPGADGEPADSAPDRSDRTMALVLPKAKPSVGDAPRTPDPRKAGDGEAGGGQDAAPKAKPGERVDQPTTMLKLPTPAAAPVQPPAAAPNSKFVPLKPDVTRAVPQVGPERTTQQPLPPKPPLDLLAELTNTPPPAETTLRTTVRRIKIWTPLVVLLAIVFAIVQAVRPLPTPTLKLTAADTYAFDGGKVDIPWPADGQAALDVQGIGTFGSSGDQKPVPIASVAKVMTAYVILRDHELKSGAAGPKIKIDQTAEDQSDAGQESTVDVTAGDTISQREAVESILIASANNVARLLARWDAGSEKAFVEKMNAAAEDLGMKNTTYTDPSGLNDTTVSTAVDQVKLAKKAMEFPAFREVAAMMSYDDYKGVNHSNWNQLVGKNDVVGIKTGTTSSALGNLVFAAKKDAGGETKTIVGAVLRQPAGGVDNTILSAALTAGDDLIRAAQDALTSATIIKKGEVVGYVDDGLGNHTAVVATKDVTAVGWSGLTVKLTFAGDDVPHTAKAGTQVGTLTVGDTGAGAVKVPVALQTDLVEPGFTDKLTRIA
ncbi:serine hydrolase [Streptomyces sp. NPDC090106]|uniref:serine hydrolase n=1 Tax=Streptomyces sp. NPDC090106 TaxID=3365946 RepID=UPI00382ACDA0